MALTKTQREKASRLWAEGFSMKEIVHVMGITFNELKRETYYYREMYPRRYAKRKEW